MFRREEHLLFQTCRGVKLVYSPATWRRESAPLSGDTLLSPWKVRKRLKNTIEPYYFIHIDIIWLIIRNFRDFHWCPSWLKIVSKWKRSQKYEQILGDQDFWWKLKSWVHRPIWSKSHQWYFPQFAFSLLLCSCMFETVEFCKHLRGYATQL